MWFPLETRLGTLPRVPQRPLRQSPKNVTDIQVTQSRGPRKPDGRILGETLSWLQKHVAENLWNMLQRSLEAWWGRNESTLWEPRKNVVGTLTSTLRISWETCCWDFGNKVWRPQKHTAQAPWNMMRWPQEKCCEILLKSHTCYHNRNKVGK